MGNYYNTEWAASEIERARNKRNGRPLANNTRLFANDDGSYSIKLHNTYIIIINADGTYTLNSGGYQTVTTLDRMRTYSPVQLFSEKGNWYVWMTPNEDDPRPMRVNSPISAPFERPADYEQGDSRYFDYHKSYHTERRQREYDAMMERFNNNVAVWRTERDVQYKARRRYLKAEREWQQRNRVPFYDGIVVDSDGYVPRVRNSGPSPAKLRRHEARVAKMRKRIDKYVDGYIATLTKGMPMPGNGDCWYCLGLVQDAVVTGDRVTVNDGPSQNHEHLLSHMTDKYYVPSLAVNALRERGYRDAGIYMWLDMNPEAGTMGGGQDYKMVKRDLTKYLVKRLVPAAPIN